MNLEEKIKQRMFYPEVYVYPAPRCYKPLKKLNLEKIDFGEIINLYIHIPFCKSICSYCGYLKIINNDKIKADYVQALCQEILSYKQVLKNKIVNTVHFGGGTPTLLSREEMSQIIKSLEIVFPDFKKTAKEISLEGTPNSITEKNVAEYISLGFNRVSLGVQTFCPSELSLARRLHDNSDVKRAIKILRSQKIPNIVVDLMLGIAGQTIESFRRSVEKLIQLKPDTVEIYALGIMPHTGWHNKKEKFMSNKDKYRCYDLARKLFLQAGYGRDDYNRYVLPERGSFLQEDNVFKGEALVGFGAGARTYTPKIHYRNSYFANNHQQAILKYVENIKNRKNSIQDGCRLNLEEKTRQYAIYNIKRLDLVKFKRQFKASFEKKFGVILKILIKHKMGEVSGQYFFLTKKGLLFKDLIAHELYSREVKITEKNYRHVI